ncbi:efflux RND transporter periplasmic adaptor subunit [Prosthecobacter dejongeii]|uniref:RND family efflux transporter MFP subunit n=1 Tax=Prosthecobacter dejongeii TaxID=48465 RepID=A0A7W7YPZ3_9BACT|nr:efflux RND transporter periplasmic adaptor subunit [Prosthecobacter dejongeii]MBB5040196.1 RND family efflux transporter MFP subunit [Prosthecobacter dejongeii]
MKRTSLILLMAAAYCVVACQKAAPDPAASPAPEAVPPPIQGSTVKATERSFPRFLRVTGQLAGQHDAVVAADSTGRVMTAPVERGSIVKPGDVLATLDDRQAKLTLAEAHASAELAKSRLALAKNEQERNKPLAEKKAVADADYQKLLTEVSAREAELAAAISRQEQAQKTLDDCVIRAVAGGVVAERMVDPGEYVRMDSAVARVVDQSTMRLVLNVPETEVGGLEIGQTVEFTTAAFAGQTFKGQLKFLGAAMREASRDLVIEATVDNADGKLRAGFFCDARIQMREEKAVAVPEDALRIEGSRRKVFVVTPEANTLSERLVEVGDTREGFTEIRKGVVKDETVLVKPPAEATDGLPFQPKA